MPEAAVQPAPRERRWTWVLLALAAFALVPAFSPLRAVVPIEQTLWLLVPALAVCALVGWWAGGRFTLALVWGALATLVVVRSLQAGAGQYATLANGWSLLAAGAFGVVCIFAAGSSFLPRALSAIGLALLLALGLAAVGVFDPLRAERVLAEQFAARNGVEVEQLETSISTLRRDPETFETVDRVARALPGGDGWLDSARYAEMLAALSRAALAVFPALLALESLAALALAWALYHRLARTRIGAPLGRLREFRFNDQLVWGLIVGAAALLLPTLAPLRGLGLNLLVFFGALFALRGLGVLIWFLANAGVVVLIALGLVALLLFPAMTAIALGLGLGDTWIDWRGRARESTGSTL